MQRIHILITLAALVLFPAAATAQTWAVAPVKGVNIHPDFTKVVSVLLIQHLTEEGITVIDMSNDAAFSPDAAFEKGASAYVVTTILRMGEKVKVSAQVFDKGGKVKGAANLTAANPDDLDSVTARVSRALITGESPHESETIYEVTESDEVNLRQKKANSYWGLRIGGMTHFSSKLTKQPVKPGLGLVWLFDPRIFLIEVGTDFYWGHASKDDFSEFSWSLDVAGYYPFTQGGFCPYIGGGIGFGTRTSSWQEAPDAEGNYDTSTDTDYGLTVFAGTGILIGRTSTVSVRAELRYFVDTFTVRGEFSNGIMYFASVGF